MGFNIHILSGRRPSQNLDLRAAVAASFNPQNDSIRSENALEGRRGASIPAPPADILTFSLHDGRLIKR
jgi:hypothetical protein